MIDIEKRIKVIKSLLDQGDRQALTYAALESRLSIELICYDRLRISYDNISWDELRTWQPQKVVQEVVEYANDRATQSFTFSISKTPVSDSSRATTKEEFESFEYVKVGEQAALDLRTIGRLWHSLSNVALHVSFPKCKEHELDAYGNEAVIRSKVSETVQELEKLQHGNLLAGPFGEISHFSCETCEWEIKRTLKLLRHGQVVYCPRPGCDDSYLAHQEGDDFFFSRRVVHLTCQICKVEFNAPLKIIEKLRFSETKRIDCSVCGEENYIQLRPVQVAPIRNQA